MAGVRARLTSISWSIVLAIAAGCGGRSDSGHARFIPGDESARQALTAALAAWQNGQAPGTLGDSPVPVEVIDTERRRGQRLTGFSILGEVAGIGPRCFLVRLALDSPREDRRVRFVVLGQNPLWVMRFEDYEMIAHWEHRMHGAAPSAPAVVDR